MFTGIVTDIGEITAVTPGGNGGDRRFVIAHPARHGADRDRRLDRLLGLLPDGGREGRRLVRRRGLGRDAWPRPHSATGSSAAGSISSARCKLGDELGGHLVSGHVDGVGTIVSMTPEGGSMRFVFEAPPELARFVAPKGSVAIDGVSLTVNEVDGQPLRRQHYPAHPGGYHPGTGQAGPAGQPGGRHAGALRCAPVGARKIMSALEKDAWRITFSEVKAAAEDIIEEARNGPDVHPGRRRGPRERGRPRHPGPDGDARGHQLHGQARRGLICLALTRERVEQLGLPLMAQNNGTRHQTAFTVSIEAREGVTTGISAADRARTIAVAIDPTCGAAGHRHAGPRLPAGGARRRRAGARRPHRGRGRHRAARRPHARPA